MRIDSKSFEYLGGKSGNSKEKLNRLTTRPLLSRSEKVMKTGGENAPQAQMFFFSRGIFSLKNIFDIASK